MATSEQVQDMPLLTAEQFFMLPEVPGVRLELIEGKVVEVPFATHAHAVIVRVLFRLLDAFAVTHNLGEVFGDGLGFVIHRDPDSVRGPDVSFIAKSRYPATPYRGDIPFAPDLAVEVVSPGDTAAELRRKVRQYLNGGTQVVWVVWPDDRTVSVHAAGTDVPRELREEDELDGGDVLPGFRVRVGDLFADAA